MVLASFGLFRCAHSNFARTDMNKSLLLISYEMAMQDDHLLLNPGLYEAASVAFSAALLVKNSKKSLSHSLTLFSIATASKV